MVTIVHKIEHSSADLDQLHLNVLEKNQNNITISKYRLVLRNKHKNLCKDKDRVRIRKRIVKRAAGIIF